MRQQATIFYNRIKSVKDVFDLINFDLYSSSSDPFGTPYFVIHWETKSVKRIDVRGGQMKCTKIFLRGRFHKSDKERNSKNFAPEDRRIVLLSNIYGRDPDL